MQGRCACGGVTVTVARPPEYINICNCSLCRRLGGAMAYYDQSEVQVEGTVRDFVRQDLDEVYLANQFCPTCGTVIRWLPLPSYDSERTGVNMRLFDPEQIAGTECRFPDGIDWTDEAPAERHPPLPYGEGIVF